MDTMHKIRPLAIARVLSAGVAVLCGFPAPTTRPPTRRVTSAPHHAQHDFDWQLGTWKIHMSRLQHPLSASTTWTELNGTLGVPMVGEFNSGRGEFYDQEPFNGRSILVRLVFSAITADSARDEQSFSTDGGKTWEVNWVNISTRVKAGA
jgi:hypothetical protein